MSDDRKPGYDAVIPARVLYDPILKDKAKLLFGVIRSLSSREGYCWASNAYLCSILGISKSCLGEHLKALSARGHIYGEVITDEATNQVLERRIWVDRGRYLSRDPDVPPPDFRERGIPDSRDTPPPDFREEKINSIDELRKEAPQKPPTGGRRPKKPKRAPRKAPDWKPERFAGFWDFYPRSEAKQKAMDAWDRLQPSDELIDEIARALQLLMKTKDWQEGIGIPYASTWLNQARWEDADGLKPASRPASSASGWAEDPEVM
ncbi:MAG: helix-turn-helix domain-containing protein [Clostridia bacterium]|nr:helix-turn-helix domain-containing protein [Clostridia bacterium]